MGLAVSGGCMSAFRTHILGIYTSAVLPLLVDTPCGTLVQLYTYAHYRAGSRRTSGPYGLGVVLVVKPVVCEEGGVESNCPHGPHVRPLAAHVGGGGIGGGKISKRRGGGEGRAGRARSRLCRVSCVISPRHSFFVSSLFFIEAD